ncbi:MAG: cytochrome c3 family protein [Fimbriimonas sp.]|nr:cytochrome c3 family protein [Fimbriimonas sp.]
MLSIGIASLVFGAMQAGKSPAAKATADKPDKEVIQINQRFSQAKPEDYIGDAACVECHSTKSHSFNESAHFAFMSDPKLPLSQRGCEGCHGPGKAHQDNPDTEVISFGKLSPKDSAAACLRCHAQTMDKSSWKHTEHAKANLACVTCHQIHPDTDLALEDQALKKGRTVDPKSIAHLAKQPDKQLLLKADEITLCGQCHQSEVAQFRLSYHHPVLEGQLVCSDCHATHPSKAAQSKQSAFKSKCVTCHADKAGPFVYEHDPVAGFGGSGCEECHSPHGSQNPNMLVTRTRGLCAQCHSDKLATHHPGETCWSAGCHVAPHGSNSSNRFLSY